MQSLSHSPVGPQIPRTAADVEGTLHMISSWAAHKKGFTNCTLTESDSPTSKVSLTKWPTRGQCTHHHTDWIGSRCPSKRRRGQLLCRQYLSLLLWGEDNAKNHAPPTKHSDVFSKYVCMLRATSITENPLFFQQFCLCVTSGTKLTP